MNTPASDHSKNLHDGKSQYQGREMDERARKLKKDNLRQLNLQRHQLELKELDLKTWQAHNAQLLKEINALKNHTVTKKVFSFGPVKPIAHLDLKVVERETKNEIDKLEHEIVTIERENTKIEQDASAKKKLLEDKGKLAEKHDKDVAFEMSRLEEGQKSYLAQIGDLQEVVGNKKVELKKVENEEAHLKSEIEILKRQTAIEGKTYTAEKVRADETVSQKRLLLNKLQSELSELIRVFELKKQELEKRIGLVEKELEEPPEIDKKENLNDALILATKEKRERDLLKQIQELREEVRVKTAELKRLLDRSNLVGKTLPKLKMEQQSESGAETEIKEQISKLQKENNDEIVKNKEAIEKLKQRIITLKQSLEIKQKEFEQAKAAEQQKQVQSQRTAQQEAQKLQEKETEFHLYENRIRGAEQEEKMIQDKIQKLSTSA